MLNEPRAMRGSATACGAVDQPKVRARSGITVVALAMVLALLLAVLGLAPTGRAYADDGYGVALKATGLSSQSLTYSGESSAKLNKKSLQLVYGRSAVLNVTGNKSKKITWTSSNKSVATVKATSGGKAKVVAKNAGKATITAKVDGKKLTCKVTVKGKLSKAKVSMDAFDTVSLKLKGAKAKSWKSSDTKVVTVSKSGVLSCGTLVTGLTSAKVTCTDTKGNKYVCKVNVGLPNVKCEMTGTSTLKLDDTWYFKRFTIENRCGYTIKLNERLMVYYPYKQNTDVTDVLFGCDNAYSTKYFDDEPQYVSNGHTYNFYGFEGRYSSYYPAYSDRTFTLYMTVNGTKYLGIFNTDGDFLCCSEAK